MSMTMFVLEVAWFDHRSDHNPWKAVRVGEASHPGPAGSRRTERMRKENEDEQGMSSMVSVMKPLLAQLLSELIREYMSDGGLAELLGPGGPSFAKTKKKKKKRAKKTKTGYYPLAPCPRPLPAVDEKKQTVRRVELTEPEPRLGKGKGKGQPAVSDVEMEEWTEVKKKLKGQKHAEKQSPQAPKKQSDSEQQWQLRAQDWDAPVIPFEGIAAAITEQTDKLRGVVLVPNGEQKIVVENMVVGAGHKHALLLVVPGRLSPDRATSRVPGTSNGKLCFRDASVIQ